jgi:hypothetical protein
VKEYNHKGAKVHTKAHIEMNSGRYLFVRLSVDFGALVVNFLKINLPVRTNLIKIVT